MGERVNDGLDCVFSTDEPVNFTPRDAPPCVLAVLVQLNQPQEDLTRQGLSVFIELLVDLLGPPEQCSLYTTGGLIGAQGERVVVAAFE